jgi:hypothetical protein
MTNLKLEPVDTNPPGPPHNPDCALAEVDPGDWVLYSESDSQPKTEAIRTNIVVNLRKTL